MTCSPRRAGPDSLPDMADPRGPRTGDVQSVHRALDLLEAVARLGEAGVTELARELGLNTSTTHNLLKTMTKRGYLLVADGRYRLGPAVTTMTARFDPAVALPTVIRPAMEAASRATRINVLAAVLVGNRLQSVGWAGTSSLIYQVGSPREEWAPEAALEPAAGRVLVAMTRRSEWPDYIAAAAAAEPDWTPQQWEGHLEQIAATGLCVKFDPRRYLAVGVPVWSGDQVVICSLACAVPASLATPDLVQTTLDALWAATAQISPLLGCPELPYPKPTVSPAQLEAVRRVATTG